MCVIRQCTQLGRQVITSEMHVSLSLGEICPHHYTPHHTLTGLWQLLGRRWYNLRPRDTRCFFLVLVWVKVRENGTNCWLCPIGLITRSTVATTLPQRLLYKMQLAVRRPYSYLVGSDLMRSVRAVRTSANTRVTTDLVHLPNYPVYALRNTVVRTHGGLY